MGTKKTELQDGCFAKAMDDEPMFVLLARDVQAPKRVRDWAIQRKSEIALGQKPVSDMPMVDEAFETADRMEEWRVERNGAWRNGLFGDQPNAETQVAMREVRSGNLTRHESVKSLMDDLNGDKAAD